ncbi:DNA mismatch repair protein MutS, type 2 [Wolffia australiana]
MLQSVAVHWTSLRVAAPSYGGNRLSLRIRASGSSQLLLGGGSWPPPSSRESVLRDSLRVLEWDKICDAVAAFAGTAPGRDATKESLWRLDLRYEDSQTLLTETAAAVEMIKYGASGTEFSGIDIVLVKSAISNASRGLPISGMEAITICSLLELSDTLQTTVKTAAKEDPDLYNRFMPVSQVIMELNVYRPFIKMVNQVIDEDGSVKDSASSELRRLRDQVRGLEQKLYQLMDKLMRTNAGDGLSMELSILSGRWCVKAAFDQSSKIEGLLLSSPGVESFIEPLSAISLNDELQQAKSLVARAEDAVLSKLTDKMVAELDGLRSLVDAIIKLDVVFARAKYGLAFGGTFPLLSSISNDAHNMHAGNLASDSPDFSNTNTRKLYLRKAFHPLLLKKRHDNLQQAKKDLTNAASEMRRARLQGIITTATRDGESHLDTLKRRVSQIEADHPVPIDFIISSKTNVLVITGPNTGGKTIGLKTIGLASMMAKSGLYILACEPAELPWFDSVFADIGDEQSLAQSLSTFSGHLKQISEIQSHCTKQSLVLLDEVGAGTNPLEGAALGLSLLESFSDLGALLTIATTHHGELKTLKYSNKSFENACVEFDEVKLKPTYKILWGVPGRSNAINIAERLGLPSVVLENARKLYGTASAEINGVIVDMERLKQEFQAHVHESQHYIKLTRRNHEALLASKERLNQHALIQSQSKAQAIRGAATVARSLLNTKLQQFRERSAALAAAEAAAASAKEREDPGGLVDPPSPLASKAASGAMKKTKNPDVGDEVFVPSLGRKAVVLELEPAKGEAVVQSGNMKLRLKLSSL